MSAAASVVDLSRYARPGRKRQKVDELGRFAPGNIYAVKVTNFTTYDYAEFKLAPALNMIIGPNGSGKSTLVAAICLGLAGKTEWIKRKNIKTMIKSGKREASIEITLVDEANKLVAIERTINDKSAWKIDGRPSSEKAVKDICQKLNIQLDNLCHFLPQERVAEFAGMTPEKLLLETEKTLASGNLYTVHQELVSIDEKREAVTETLTKSGDRLSKLEAEKEKLEKEVERFQQYNQKARELENHKYLLPFAVLEDEKHRKNELRRQRDLAKQRLQEFNSNADPLRSQLQSAESTLHQQRTEVKDIENNLRETKDDLEEAKSNSKKCYDAVQKLGIELADRKSSSKRKAQELAKLEEEINELSASLDSVPDVDDTQLSELKNNRNQYHNELNEVSSSLEDVGGSVRNLERKTAELKRQGAEEEKTLSGNDKLAILAPTGNYQNKLQKNTFDLHTALRRDTAYQGKYHECPIISCAVADKRFGKFIERAIGNNNLMSITIDSRDVYRQMSGSILKRYNAPVRVITERAPQCPISRDTLRQFGFDGYLSDYITGPEEVLNMLNSNSKLNFIPVSSTPLSEEQLKTLLSPDSGRLPFMKFVAGNEMFTVYRSKYGSQQHMYNTQTVPEARFFDKSGLSEEAKREIRSRISYLRTQIKQIETERSSEVAKLNSLQNQKEEVTYRMKEVQNELHKLQGQKKEKERRTNMIITKRRRQQQLRQEMAETNSSVVKQLQTKIMEKHTTLASIMKEVSRYIAHYTQLKFDLNDKNLLVIQTENKIAILNNLIDEFGHYRENLEKIFVDAQERYKAMTNNEVTLQIRAQRDKYAEGQEQEIADLATEYLQKKILTQAHVEDRIYTLEQERSLMSTTDFGAISKLARIKEDIEQETRQIPRLEREKQNLDDRIKDLQSQWEPELTALVAEISRSFRKRFSSVASDGQVELAKSERYKDWRLQILVKFREDADLKILDRQSQSGGERAVSTIFFIMALQGLTNAPFRVVDEINQGMDPKNERAVHKYLVHTACAKSKSQYFLVTPKLLTGLYYHKDMVVHCIYTGPFIDPVNRQGDDFLDLRKLIET